MNRRGAHFKPLVNESRQTGAGDLLVRTHARKARYGTIQTFSKICHNYGLLLLATESSRPAIEKIFDRRENENSHESATRKGQIVFANHQKKNDDTRPNRVGLAQCYQNITRSRLRVVVVVRIEM